MILDPDKLTQEQWCEYEDIWRSQRYHLRRQKFFSIYNNITQVLTILLVGSAFFNVTETWAFKALAGISAVFVLLDCYVKFAEKMAYHGNQYKKYNELQAAMEIGSLSEKAWLAHSVTRRELEDNESMPYKIVDILSRNETLIAMGHNSPQLYKVNWFLTITANLCHWENVNPELITK